MTIRNNYTCNLLLSQIAKKAEVIGVFKIKHNSSLY